jgi:hypothetical protein
MKRLIAIVSTFLTPMVSFAYCQMPMYSSNPEINNLSQNLYQQCIQNEESFRRQQQQQIQQQNDQSAQQSLSGMQSTLQKLQNPSYRQNQQTNKGARLLGQ